MAGFEGDNCEKREYKCPMFFNNIVKEVLHVRLNKSED